MAIYRGTGLQGEGGISDFSQLVQDAQAAADAAEQAYADTIAVYGSITAVNNAVTAAQLAETNAETAEVNAETAETNAEAAAINATNSATSAATSATNAANSATSAANSVTTATTQATNAANSASTASTSASNAATSATNAANSATSSANSANSAASSATSAANSATTATASANTAISKANEATASASSAATSAAAASSSATLAATSVTDAAGYVNDALDLYNGSAALDAAVDAAQASATASANSATASANSATQATTNGAIQVALATTQATNAAASATASANSATNAANSATQAANSAASAAAIVTGVASNRPSVRPSLLLDFSNTKQLDPRITFSRPTTATYYDGKTVVKAEENLQTFSQEFDNAVWVKYECSVTANASTAPDGTTTADSLLESSNNAQHFLRVGAYSLTAAVTTVLSVYVKANGRNYFALQDGSTTYGSYFNIVAGGSGTVLGSFGTTPASASLSYIGNDWYRASIVFTSASTTRPIIITSDTGSNTLYVGDETKGLYIWGAQVEQRSSVSSYTPTTSSPITNYIPALQTAAAGVPRFDHDPVTGESKGLLIEEQRTNLLTYSDQFDNAAWVKTNLNVTADVNVAPNGTLVADKLYEDTNTGLHRTYQGVSVTSGVSYTYSIYVKAAGRTKISINNSLMSGEIFYDLSAVTSSSATLGTITSVGNGWYRCTYTGTASSTATYNIEVRLVTGTNTTSYTGDGYSGLYIWGAQLEAGSFPTSYIPTVASQVTRSADSASMTGSNFSSWYNNAEGTLYWEAIPMSIANTDFTTASINDTTANNRFILGSYGSVAYESIYSNGSPYANINSNYNSIAVGVAYKAAGVAKTNDFAISAQGTSVATDTSGLMPMVTQLEIGKSINTRYLNGTIKRIAFWPKRLSNTELQGLTS